MITKIRSFYEKYKDSDLFISVLLAIIQSCFALSFVFVDFVFSKKLDQVSFGLWKQMFFIISLVVPFFSLGIPEGYKYYIAKEENKKSTYSSSAFFMLILLTLTGVLFFIIARILHSYKIINIENYLYIGVIFPIAFLFFNLNKTLRYLHINNKKVREYGFIVILSFIPTLSIIYFLSGALDKYLDFFLWFGASIYIIIFALPVITTIFQTSQFSLYPNKINKKAIKKMLKVGLPLYLATFIGVLTLSIDKGIVYIFEDEATFAVFAIGALEIPVFGMLSASFSHQIYPKLVRLINSDQRHQAKALWIETTKRVSYITYPCIFLLMIFAKPLIYFLYTPEYKESVILFQVYLLIGLFRNNYYGALIVASGNAKHITYYSAMTLLLNLIISFSLYNYFGIEGIVWATLISTIIINLAQLNHEKLLKSYIENFLMDKKILFLFMLIILSFIYNKVI